MSKDNNPVFNPTVRRTAIIPEDEQSMSFLPPLPPRTPLETPLEHQQNTDFKRTQNHNSEEAQATAAPAARPHIDIDQRQFEQSLTDFGANMSSLWSTPEMGLHGENAIPPLLTTALPGATHLACSSSH